MTGSHSEINFSEPPTKNDPKVRKPDIGRAREILDWEPKVARPEGLQRTLTYFRERLDAEAGAAPGPR